MEAVDKQDLQNVYKEIKDTNKKNTEICVKLTRLFCTLETLTENQKEHHESLYDPETGLDAKLQAVDKRVQRIENYATVIGGGGGATTIFVAFKEKIVSFFS